MRDDPDVVRGMTVRLDNVAGSDGAGFLLLPVELCPENRIYAYELVAQFEGEVVPEIMASILLQDSQIDLDSFGCKLRGIDADLPGLRWPASAKLKVFDGCRATLVLTYGNCG